jgi:hypothetical protein
MAPRAAGYVKDLGKINKFMFCHFQFSIKKPTKLSQGGHKKSLSLRLRESGRHETFRGIKKTQRVRGWKPLGLGMGAKMPIYSLGWFRELQDLLGEKKPARGGLALLHVLITP